MKINNLFVHNNSKVTRVALVFVLILASTALVFSGALPLGKEIAFASELHTGCKAVYLVDADSGIEMYSHRSDDKLPIASMVKIMTTLLAFEAIERDELSLDDMVEFLEALHDCDGMCDLSGCICYDRKTHNCPFIYAREYLESEAEE
jgi:hypothetical protein